MIVRFDFKCNGDAVADIDDARVFARSLQHVRAFGGQLLQMYARAFVGAMFAPHHAENSQFREARFAPKEA